MKNKLLVLDFDGTLCLGEDPVLAYASRVDQQLRAAGLTAPHRASVRSTVEAALEANHLLGPHIAYAADGHPTAVPRDPVEPVGGAHPVSWPLQDGYQLTQLLARQAGLSDHATGEAFLAGRDDLLAKGLEETDVHAPSEAPALLTEMRTHVAVVLISNSPADGFSTWLEALGLRDSFDAVINSAAKPFGMPQALEQVHAMLPGSLMDSAASTGEVRASALMSVGDIWANDLEHVAEMGGNTVLIDRFSTGLGSPDHRVKSWNEAAPVLRSWAAAPSPAVVPQRSQG